MIFGGQAGIGNGGSIGSLINTATGVITATTGTGIVNFGTIGSLENKYRQDRRGVTLHQQCLADRHRRCTGIYNGFISGISNSGTITGTSYAWSRSTGGNLGPIANSGTIAGYVFDLRAGCFDQRRQRLDLRHPDRRKHHHRRRQPGISPAATHTWTTTSASTAATARSPTTACCRSPPATSSPAASCKPVRACWTSRRPGPVSTTTAT